MNQDFYLQFTCDSKTDVSDVLILFTWINLALYKKRAQVTHGNRDKPEYVG